VTGNAAIPVNINYETKKTDSVTGNAVISDYDIYETADDDSTTEDPGILGIEGRSDIDADDILCGTITIDATAFDDIVFGAEGLGGIVTEYILCETDDMTNEMMTVDSTTFDAAVLDAGGQRGVDTDDIAYGTINGDSSTKGVVEAIGVIRCVTGSINGVATGTSLIGAGCRCDIDAIGSLGEPDDSTAFDKGLIGARGDDTDTEYFLCDNDYTLGESVA